MCGEIQITFLKWLLIKISISLQFHSNEYEGLLKRAE